MSSKVVRDKVIAYLDANWVDTIIAGEENVVDSPPDNLDPWLTYDFESFDEIHLNYTHCNYTEVGTIVFTVWVSSGSGTESGVEFAESVRTMFRGLDLLDGVRCRNANSPETYGLSSDGNYFGVEVDVNYEYFYTK